MFYVVYLYLILIFQISDGSPTLFRKIFVDREFESAFQESNRRDDVSSSKNDDGDDENDDTAGRDCPSYQKLADMIPWGDRGEKCCLDRSSPQNRRDTCYTNQKGTPWQSLPQLPACPNEIDPQFFIFTPEDREESVKKHASPGDNFTSQIIEYANLNKSLENVALNKKRQFFTIIHGYHTKSWDKNWMFTMKDVLLELGHNVMVVKWVNGSNVKDYTKAAANTRSVGTAVANVLDKLIAAQKIVLEQTTLMGFSLGAHISGYVGSLFNGTVPRIFAMDPAGPLFACEDKTTRLDPSDAKFVQVVHTNGESFLNGGLGTPERMGHVDFYPNGGLVQPGCPHSLVGKIAKKVVTFDFSSLKDVSCSHSTAPLIVTDILRRSTTPIKSSKDACRFQTFSCSNGKDWKWGRCFRKCQNSTQCPAPGLDLLFSTPPKIYQEKIYFNTLARSNETDSPEFCGRQHLVTITSTTGAKGSIRLRLFDQKFGWSNQSKFQRSNHKLKKDVPRSEVIVSDWKIEDVSKIELNYTRYKNKILKNGPMWFNLTNITIEEASGLQKYNASSRGITVVSEKLIVIDLK